MLTIFQGTKGVAHLARLRRCPATSHPGRAPHAATRTTGRCRGGAADAFRGSGVGSKHQLGVHLIAGSDH